MKDVRITPNVVGELGIWAEGVTGLKGWLGEVKNPGDGYVYVSNRPVGGMKNWKGPRAGHMCASYLFGVIQASVKGRELLATPDHWLADVKAAVQVNAREFNEGQADAEYAIGAARAAGGRDLRAIREAGA